MRLHLLSFTVQHTLTTLKLFEFYGFSAAAARLTMRSSEQRLVARPLCIHRLSPPASVAELESVGLGNLLCVCPNCHKELDYRVERIDFTGLTIDPRHGFRRSNADYHNRKVDEQQGL